MPTKTFLDLSDKKRERILNAARRVFSSDEYDKISIQDIIKEAGIPRGSFYQYFEDKEDLYLYLHILYAEKSYKLHYADNMDYLINRIYFGSNNSLDDQPWFKDAVNRMHLVMTDDEVNFALKTPLPPERIMNAIFDNSARMFYPIVASHLSKSVHSYSDSDLAILAYMLAFADSIISDLSSVRETSREEAWELYSDFVRKLYEHCTMNSSADEAELSDIISIHFISSSGTSLTVIPDFMSSWSSEQTSDSEICRSIPLVKSSTQGRTSTEFRCISSSGSDISKVSLTVSSDGLTRTVITDCGIEAELEGSYTAVATIAGGKRICIIDEGKFLL